MEERRNCDTDNKKKGLEQRAGREGNYCTQSEEKVGERFYNGPDIMLMIIL